MSLCDLAGSVGNSQAALPTYRDGLKTLEEAVAPAPPNTFNQDEEIARHDIENDPNNDDFSRAYAAATSQLAAAQLATGDALGAVATYRRAVAFIGPMQRIRKANG